jgi:putative lysine transport system ATP-binding protein
MGRASRFPSSTTAPGKEKAHGITDCSLSHVSKTFDGVTVVKDVSFDVHEGECLAIIGSSGSGKSTLLRCINRLEEPSGGDDSFRRERHQRATPRKNFAVQIAMVFQSFDLFANYDVLGNCVLGQSLVLKRERRKKPRTSLCPI